MPNPCNAAALFRALSSKLIPWTNESVAERFVVAHSTYREFQEWEGRLPAGVRVSRSGFKGPRVAVKGPSSDAQTRLASARWPEDALEAQRVPTLLCVLDGQADWHVGEYTLHCASGHIIVSPSGVPTADGSRSHLDPQRGESATCDLLWFTPWADWMHCAMCHSRGLHHWKRPEESVYIRSAQARTYFDDMIQETVARKSGHERVFASLLPAFLTIVQRELEQGTYVPWWPLETPATENDKPDAADPIARARKYIREHLAEPLTIDQVAGIVYLSRSHFAKKFHDESGQTFTEYLTALRLRQAKELLRGTRWSIVAICRSVGITPGRLAQIFHSHEGLSPQAYRRETLGQSRADDSKGQ